MNRVYVQINDELLTLEVDSETYSQLCSSDAFRERYINYLFTNNYLHIEDEVLSVLFSSDNQAFYVVNFRNSEPDDVPERTDPLESPPDVVGTQEMWGNGATKFILEKYELYLKCVGPMKKFKTKKCMWLQISKDLNETLGISRTPVQIENRYKTIIKRKKKSVDNNNSTGASRMVVEYEQELNKIAAVDDSVEPEIMRGVSKCVHKTPSPALSIADEVDVAQNRLGLSPPKKIIKKDKNHEFFAELQDKKETNKERRHQEKLKALFDLGKMFLEATKNDP